MVFILRKEINEDLWQVKPYVIITPIRIPDGLPNEDEIENFKLLSNGELIDTRKRTPQHIKVTIPGLQPNSITLQPKMFLVDPNS